MKTGPGLPGRGSSKRRSRATVSLRKASSRTGSSALKTKKTAGSKTSPKRRSKPQAVILLGFMGAGKTTIGRALAERLGWEFIDLDKRVEARQRKTITEIFQISGEAEFRRMESAELHRVLKQLVASEPAVVALGGGALTEEKNAALVRRSSAACVFLDAPVEELWRRAQEHGKRPLAAFENQFRQLYELRRPRYMEADVCITTAGRAIEVTAAEVLARLGLLDEESDGH